MNYKVYIIFSEKLNRFYVGIAHNLVNRLSEHNAGESTFTSLGIPWQLIWSTGKPTKWQALELERKLKNLSHERKIKFMIKHNYGINDSTFFE